MEIPKIKRDETKTKITNKNEIINFIMYNLNTNNLISYKNALEAQTKISHTEVIDLISIINQKLKLYEAFKNLNNDYETTLNFFNQNIKTLEKYFNGHIFNSNIDNELKNLFISFLNFSISNEENGLQNNLNIQNLFNKTKMLFENKVYNTDIKLDNEYISKIKNIYDRKDTLLNKSDNSAMDYKEDNYLSRTQVLSKTPYNINGHNINDEDLKVSGFVLTTIILEFSLVGTLITLLVLLFK